MIIIIIVMIIIIIIKYEIKMKCNNIIMKILI